MAISELTKKKAKRIRDTNQLLMDAIQADIDARDAQNVIDKQRIKDLDDEQKALAKDIPEPIAEDKPIKIADKPK